MKLSVISTTVTLLLLTGCVAPLSHTYFVPNPDDGKVVQSSSCGFLKNNEHTLERKFGDFEIGVTPDYLSDGKLVVNFSLRHPSPDITFDPKKVEVRETTKDLVLEPTNTRISSYGPDRSHPYTLSVTMYFPATASEIDSLIVSVHRGALAIGDRETTLEPFRFKEATSTDFFYASINC